MNTNLSHEEVEQIVQAFQREEITSGKARQKLGMSAIEFGKFMQERNIPVYYTSQEDYDMDARTLKHSPIRQEIRKRLGRT
ncbi:MAG: UPF0175 family protein [Chloroflexota bacterium]